LYNNDVIIYRMKKKSSEQLCLWTSLPIFYNNISQILDKELKKTSACNISLYQPPVAAIRGRIYNNIAGGIIVQQI
jgi:hypothetical protein